MHQVGFYHSDPHPGNLLRKSDGRLAYIDFGMMGEINSDIRRCARRVAVLETDNACM